MKIVCSKENLVEGINTVQKAVSTKTTLPVLEGILLESTDDRLKLTGNDLELGIECYVEADIQKTGSIILNSKMFGDIIRRLPDSELLIEEKDRNLVVIECENSHFEVRGMPAAGFPALPSIKQENAFNIRQKLMKDMIRQTIFAVGVDENRPILTGSLVECRGNELVFVSIDGFRLALRKNHVEGSDSEISVVIPGKTLGEIAKILQPVDDAAVIYRSNNQILFDIGNCKVVSRLLEGKYINYSSIIPQDSGTKMVIGTKELLSGMERASLIIMEDRRYPVILNINDEKAIITSNTELGAVREEIRIEMTGNKLDIGFNPRYFIEALRVIEDEKVEISFTTNIGPCTIRPVDNDSFAYMILPLRTKND